MTQSTLPLPSALSVTLLLGLLISSPVALADSHEHKHDDHAHEAAHKDHDKPAHDEKADKDSDGDEHKDEEKHDHHEHQHESHEGDKERIQHGSHEHGTAQLMVSLSEQKLEVILETPAANLLGFEHSPKTKEQNDHIVATEKYLKQVERLLIPASAANCKLNDYKIESPLFTASNTVANKEKEHDHEKEKAHEHNHAHETSSDKASNDKSKQDEKETHSDITVTWQWQCEKMAKLDQLSVKLFSAFPQGFERLNVEWINADKASAVKLKNDEVIMFK